MESGEVVGYEVQMRVKGLKQGEEYVFSVAAASEVGVGDYSDLSDPFSLESGMLYSYCNMMRYNHPSPLPPSFSPSLPPSLPPLSDVFFLAVFTPYIGLEMCDPENIVFLPSKEQTLISWNIKDSTYNPNCTFRVNISSCDSTCPANCIHYVHIVNGPHVKTSPDNCSQLVGHQNPCGVRVEVMFDSSGCIERDTSCRSPLMYISDVKPTG